MKTNGSPVMDERKDPSPTQSRSPAQSRFDGLAGTATLDLGKDVMRKAAADPDQAGRSLVRGADFGLVAADPRQRKVDRAFDDAAIPSCMTPEAFKFDPPHIGPIPMPGFLGTPWLLHAIVTGRCRH